MGVCDVPVISSVCDAAGEAAATLVSAPFDWLASTMGQAAGWLIEAMWKVFDSTTLVDVTAKGYLDVYNLLFGIGVLIVLLFFCFQLILGLIRREPSALSRAALGAGKAVLGSFLVITLTATALEIVDQLCIGIVQAAGETTGTMGDKIALLTAGLTGINIAAPGVGAIVTVFLAGLMICAVAIVWFSLLIRKALLLVAIVLAPVAFAGAAWDVTRSWIGKWAAFVVALIVSKLVLVVVFLIAIIQVATPIEADLSAVTEPISGIVLLFIAAFAPYMVYRFISFLGFDLYHAMGTEQEAKNALNQPIPVPSKPKSDGVKKILDGGDSEGPGGGSAPPTGGPPPTTTATRDTLSQPPPRPPGPEEAARLRQDPPPQSSSPPRSSKTQPKPDPNSATRSATKPSPPLTPPTRQEAPRHPNTAVPARRRRRRRSRIRHPVTPHRHRPTRSRPLIRPHASHPRSDPS